MVIAGDFNVCRTDLDVYDPAAFVGDTHVTDDERTRFEAILDAGLIDSFRRLHPDATAYTWWDYRAGNFHKGLGLRIDYLLATPDLANEVKRAGSRATTARGRSPPTTRRSLRRWAERRRDRGAGRVRLQAGLSHR